MTIGLAGRTRAWGGRAAPSPAATAPRKWRRERDTDTELLLVVAQNRRGRGGRNSGTNERQSGSRVTGLTSGQRLRVRALECLAVLVLDRELHEREGAGIDRVELPFDV